MILELVISELSIMDDFQRYLYQNDMTSKCIHFKALLNPYHQDDRMKHF